MLTGEQSVPYIPIPEDRGLRHYMIILDRTPGLVREPPCQFFMVSFRIVFLDGFFLFCSKFLHWQHSLHLIDQSITAVYFSHRNTSDRSVDYGSLFLPQENRHGRGDILADHGNVVSPSRFQRSNGAGSAVAADIQGCRFLIAEGPTDLCIRNVRL